MISSFDYYKQVINPEMYLCNPDQRELCALKAENRHLVLRFNDLSELTFTVPKEEGFETHYDLVETKRLIKLENIGWFQITSVTETIEGNRCIKSVTAESHQTEFKNRGFFTENRVYMFYNPNDPTDSRYDANDETHIPSVVGQLYQQLGIKINLSVDGDVLEDQKEWVITKIGESLKFNAQDAYNIYTPASGANNICRNFTSNNTMFGYDFMVNEASKAFGVVFIFDFLYHTIKIDLIDNVISPTDIYLSMDNLLNNINVTENAENITTVLNCNGTNADIRCVNPMGTNYVVNFDYYAKEVVEDGEYTYPWMTKELINALHQWESEYYGCVNGWDFEKTYPEGVRALNTFSKQQEEVKVELTKIKTKLNDFQNAIDRVNSNKDIINDPETGSILPSGYYIAETVDVGNNSIDPSSKFGVDLSKSLYNVEYSVAEDGESVLFANNIAGGEWVAEEPFMIPNAPSFFTKIKASDYYVDKNSQYKITLSLNGTTDTFIVSAVSAESDGFEGTGAALFGNLFSTENLMAISDDNGNVCNLLIYVGVTLNSELEAEPYEGITLLFFPVQGTGEFAVRSIEPGITESSGSSLFRPSTSLTCYKEAPLPILEEGTKRFTFSFDSESSTGTIDDMVKALDDTNFNNKGEYQESTSTTAPFLYFSDAKDGVTVYSYCKLLPAIAVGNLYDSTGNLAETDANKDFKTKGEVFFATIRDIKFKIDNGSVYVGTDGNDGEIIYGTTAVATISGDKFIYNGATYKINKPYMGIASITTCYVKGYEKYVPAIEVTGDNGWINLWQARASSQEDKIERLQSRIDSENSFIQSIHERCNIEKFIKRLYNGDALYSELRNYWIEGEYQNENIEVLEDASFSEIIDLSTQLKEAGEKELEKVSQPTFTMTAQAVNFLRLIEFKRFIDQVGLGKTVTIEKSRDVHYHPVLMSMEYDIDSSENFSLSFSNAAKIDETAMTYADLIKEASNTSRTISANWSNLIDYSKNKSTFERLINDPLNKTLSAARINDANQEFVVDKTGILGRTFTDESKTSFDNKQLRIRNNVLLFTDDGWQTAKLALGECFDGNGNSMGYGLIADTIVGTMIIGEHLNITGTITVGDELCIKSEDNGIYLNGTGITIVDGSNKRVFYADTKGELELEGTVTAKKGKFGNCIIKEDGSIVSNGGHFSISAAGHITADAGGTIGGFKIGDKCLYTGEIASMGSSDQNYFGYDGIQLNYGFKVVNEDGAKVYARYYNADMTTETVYGTYRWSCITTPQGIHFSCGGGSVGNVAQTASIGFAMNGSTQTRLTISSDIIDIVAPSGINWTLIDREQSITTSGYTGTFICGGTTWKFSSGILVGIS